MGCGGLRHYGSILSCSACRQNELTERHTEISLVFLSNAKRSVRIKTVTYRRFQICHVHCEGLLCLCNEEKGSFLWSVGELMKRKQSELMDLNSDHSVQLLLVVPREEGLSRVLTSGFMDIVRLPG
ncbi:hypothetical protein Q5P01_015805 [Channa striata]|uniref:Uncharacterized protein n=1 Tax=Channa striata TaxID=64152 RepID=A0AA88MGP5_CHASR|nr:hypothetical protein Q5P01_015805 [Channa striata]